MNANRLLVTLTLIFIPAPKKNCSISDEQCNDSISIKETVSCARRCVAKWQRGQSDSKVKKLEENVDFEILIGSKLNPMILCKLCRKSFTLAYKNGNLLVSNWSRHITQCVKSTKINRQQFYVFLLGPVLSRAYYQLLLHPLIGFQSI